MVFIWATDLCPYRTNSVSSRWPIAVIPKSAYFVDSRGVNATLAAVTSEIVTSFNKMSNTGINARDFPSLGGEVVANLNFKGNLLYPHPSQL